MESNMLKVERKSLPGKGSQQFKNALYAGKENPRTEDFIQRKASCSCGGGCPACQAKDSGLTVSHPGDASEKQADAAADKVMRMTDDELPASKHNLSQPLQQSITPVVQTKSDGDSVGSGLSGKIASSQCGGSSLDANTQSFMQNRFGTDFSGVRVHTGTEAVKMSAALGAKAFTVGNDIYFNEGQYQPNLESGRHLLAHELAHTIQQGSGTGVGRKMIQRIITEHTEREFGTHYDAMQRVPVASVSHGSAWSLCGRPRGSTTRVSGFTGSATGTHISNITITINASTTSTLTLTWANGGLSTQALPTDFNFSPGAGNCTTDCSDPCNSNQSGSHCTPISPPPAGYGSSDFIVQGYSCALRSTPSATFVTWFHYARGVAFHYLDVPSHPASHGCVRMEHSARGAEWIYDNTLPGITTVTVNRDPAGGPGPKCYRGNALIDRPADAPTGPVGACAAPRNP